MIKRPIILAKTRPGTIEGVARNVLMAQALSGKAASDESIMDSLGRHELSQNTENLAAVRAAMKKGS
jgi:hypothetical protein